MTRGKTPPQEKEFMGFLRDQNIPFKAQKSWVSYGEKEWITDFYFPTHQAIIECKDLSRTKIVNKDFIPRIERLYKDIYKLDELGELYGLQKILYVKIARNVIPLSFIANITTHRIFLMTKQSQIHPILQGIEIFAHNKERYKEEKLKLKRLDFAGKRNQLKQKHLDILWKYCHGASYRDLEVHPEQLRRLVRRFIRMELIEESYVTEKIGELNEQSLRQYLPD